MHPHRCLILITGLLFAVVSAAQLHTDKAEYGYKGPVKKIVTTWYDSTQMDEDRKQLPDGARWGHKITYSFNRLGNFDTITYEIVLPGMPGDPLKTLVTYTREGRKRTGVQVNEEGHITGTITYTFISDSAYESAETDSSGFHKVITRTQLTSSFRERSGSRRMYEGDSLVLSEDYENTLGTDGLLLGSRHADGLTGEVTINHYRYANTDKAGNPHTIYICYGEDKAVRYILLREIEYY